MSNSVLMQKLHAQLDVYVPAVVIDLLTVVLILVLCILFVRYNVPMLRAGAHLLQKLHTLLIRLTSRTATEANRKMHQMSAIKRGSKAGILVSKLDDLIVNMDLYKDGVTAFGLLAFFAVTSLIVTFLFTLIFDFGTLLPLAYVAVAYVVYTIFNVMACNKIERREALIMDVEDLLVSDISDGVYNAIVRYKDTAMSPEIAIYFQQFVENVAQNGWSFAQAMRQLEQELGPSFTDFATKAIIYEQTADKDALDMFSAVIDTNAHKRHLREQNNIVFGQVRLAFFLCLVIVIVAALLMCAGDANIMGFFSRSIYGRTMIVADIFIVAWSLAKLSALKNQRM